MSPLANLSYDTQQVTITKQYFGQGYSNNRQILEKMVVDSAVRLQDLDSAGIFTINTIIKPLARKRLNKSAPASMGWSEK